MPLAHILTNVAVDDPQALAAKLSPLVAKGTGKPESHVMCLVTPGVAMTFAGTDAPTAYVELKSIGMDRAVHKALIADLSRFLEAQCGVPASRVFIEIKELDPTIFGFNGAPLA